MTETVTHQNICVIDCETLGLDEADPIWEIAAALITPDGVLIDWAEMLVSHSPRDGWVDTRPDDMQADYRARYQHAAALLPVQAAKRVHEITSGAVLAGSNPMFDMVRLDRMLRRNAYQPKWHYHPFDIPTLVQGFLCGKGEPPAQPWKSDRLSELAGIDPGNYPRHTASGDVAWCLDMYRTVIASPIAGDGAA